MNQEPEPVKETTSESRQSEGPDPVIGAGLTLFGILIMGIGGAWDGHYLFNVGELIALVGATLFILFVIMHYIKKDPPRVLDRFRRRH